MAGLPYTKFYWNDWAGDPLLRTCSFAAQGLWMRLLCIAAESAEPGFVLLNGKPPEIEEIVKVTGGGVEEARDLIRELHARGVCGMDRRGAIYSRRLIREHQRREASAKGGRTTKDRKAGLFGDNREINRSKSGDNREHPPQASDGNHDDIPSTRDVFTRNHGINPESRVQRRVFKAPAVNPFFEHARRLCEALGLTFDPEGDQRNWPGIIERMVSDDGFDFDQDILGAVTSLQSSGRMPEEVRTPAFFRHEARRVSDRTRTERPAILPTQVDPATLTRYDWKRALRFFVESGRWFSPGPDPTKIGCLAPPDLLAEARTLWAAQGNHPEFMDTDCNFAWRPEGSPGADRVMIWPHAVPVENTPPKGSQH